nr:NADH dehydrogenase subunit 4L [Vignadula atrata]
MVYLSLVVFLVGLWIVCVKWSHLLSVFLGVEMMALSLFLLVSCLYAVNKIFLLLFVMVVSVVEAAVMLSLLVMMVRAFGDDRCSSVVCDKA